MYVKCLKCLIPSWWLLLKDFLIPSPLAFYGLHYDIYRILGIICGRKVSRITFFAIVHEKTFMIQAISYIKTPAEIKSARKHLRMLPDSQTFSFADNFHYTVNFCCMMILLAVIKEIATTNSMQMCYRYTILLVFPRYLNSMNFVDLIGL